MSLQGVPFTGMLPSGNSKRTSARLFYLTRNRKLARVVLGEYSGQRHRPVPVAPFCAATYISINATCPSTCQFKGAGCYVTEGFTAKTARNLDTGAEGLTGDEVIEVEARLIERAFATVGGAVPRDGARGGRDLRLHVGGDTPSTWAAMRLGRAAASWERNGGGKVWTFTHAWDKIVSHAWGPISVLASVETLRDAHKAVMKGYTPAIVVRKHSSVRAFSLKGSWLKWIPCPAETSGRTCVECRLCLDAKALRHRGMGIAFQAHGPGTRKMALPVLA